MYRILKFALVLMFSIAWVGVANAQADPERPIDICEAEVSSDGLQGTHCHLLSIGSGSGFTTVDGNCILERACSITSGQLILVYTGPPDPNIDVISNEGLIPTVTGGNTYQFDLTEVDSVSCGNESEFTFSMLYYVSGIPHVICELRHLFECLMCENIA